MALRTLLDALAPDMTGLSVERLMKVAAPAWWKAAFVEKRAMAVKVLGDKGRGDVAVSRFLHRTFRDDPSPAIQRTAADAMAHGGFVPVLEPPEGSELADIIVFRLSASNDINYTISLLKLLGECETVSGPQMAMVEGTIRTKQEQLGGEWRLAPLIVWTSYALIRRGYKIPECFAMLRSVVGIARQPILDFPFPFVDGATAAQAGAVSTNLRNARGALLEAVTALGPEAQPLKPDLLPLAKDPEYEEEPWRSRLHTALSAMGVTSQEIANQPPPDPDAAFRNDPLVKEVERLEALVKSGKIKIPPVSFRDP